MSSLSGMRAGRLSKALRSGSHRLWASRLQAVAAVCQAFLLPAINYAHKQRGGPPIWWNPGWFVRISEFSLSARIPPDWQKMSRLAWLAESSCAAWPEGLEGSEAGCLSSLSSRLKKAARARWQGLAVSRSGFLPGPVRSHPVWSGPVCPSSPVPSNLSSPPCVD